MKRWNLEAKHFHVPDFYQKNFKWNFLKQIIA